jgi:hypothetical protein
MVMVMVMGGRVEVWQCGSDLKQREVEKQPSKTVRR